MSSTARNLIFEAMIRNMKVAMRNCCPSAGPDYLQFGRGVFVGLVQGMMSCGFRLDKAYARTCQFKPKDFDPACDPWLDEGAVIPVDPLRRKKEEIE